MKKRCQGACCTCGIFACSGRNSRLPGSLCGLQGIKIHFRKFLYDFALKRNKLLGAGLFLFMAAGFPLSAATVSFLVIESGLPEEGGSSSWSILWENGLLDVFFEEGHIVSNAPIKRLELKPRQEFPDEAVEDLSEAAAGGCEYFILALLDYPPAAGTEIPRPRNIVLRVFKAGSRQLLYEQPYDAARFLNRDDEFSRIKQSIRGLIPHLTDRPVSKTGRP